MDPIDAAEIALSLPEIDPDQPSPARIYDFWLGGSQNFAADREVGRRAALAMPTLQAAIRANRAFLGRVARHLAEDRGIFQFLDLGSGVPTVGNVHEIVQRVRPDTKVVYVDIDPVAVAHARALLAGDAGARAILADLRRPDTVLSHPLLRDTLDLSQPIAVLMFAVLHFIPDAEKPADLVASYVESVAPGSFLALSHAAPDTTHPDAQHSMEDEYRKSTRVPFISREPDEISSWLDGLEIQPPGLVPVDQWHPDPEATQAPILRTYGVLGRKPTQ